MTAEGRKTVPVRLPHQNRTVNVPVDKDGYVDQDFLASWRGYSHRDYDKTHNLVLPSKLTPRQAAAWLDDPDSCDIEEIDVKGRPRHNIGNRKGEDAEFQKKIAVYGTASEEKKIRALLDDAFPSQKDRDSLVSKGEISVVARKMDPRVAGNTNSIDVIQINRGAGMNNATLVHEGTHCLRNRDGRSGKTKSVVEKYRNPSYKSVEESLTVAESLAREKDDRTEAYYYYVPVRDGKSGRWRNPTDGEVRTMYLQDKRLFSEGHPKTDSAAVKAVNDRWAKSHISRLKVDHRGKMAINTVATYDKTVDPIRERTDRNTPPTGKRKTGRKPQMNKPAGRSTKGTGFMTRLRRRH